MRFRLLAGVLAALLISSLSAPVHAQETDVTPARAGGADRFETAAIIAGATYPDGNDTAVLANGIGFADALASAYIAGVLNAPVLLTQVGSLPQATADALVDLGVEEIMLIGGPAAISAEVSNGLIAAGYTLNRVSGDDRYETAAAAALQAQDIAADPVGTVNGERVAIIASGESFPDALAAGPLAFGGLHPLFLAQRGQLTVPTVNAIAQLNIDRVLVVGGTDVLPTDDAIRADLQVGAGDVEVTRIAGVNRYATAALIGDFALANLGWTPATALIARGDTFPDALAAASHGGILRAPILLAESPGVLGSAAQGWLTAACPDVDVVRALGGTDAVSIAVLSAAIDAAEACEDNS